MTISLKTIKSSEIASYIFCPVCWWTERTTGVKVTPAISKGEAFHQDIARNQSKARTIYFCIRITIFIIATLIIYRFLR
ncbi:hypothetical protein HYS31_01990 [Candidatus Woesearchaeota archaeon]|nr:hypothetical protein [Candidatus Woesearchaeota archaeon]